MHFTPDLQNRCYMLNLIVASPEAHIGETGLRKLTTLVVLNVYSFLLSYNLV